MLVRGIQFRFSISGNTISNVKIHVHLVDYKFPKGKDIIIVKQFIQKFLFHEFAKAES